VPRLIGEAYVAILPDTTKFERQANTKIRAALTGINPSINIGANTAGAAAKIKALNALAKGGKVNVSANASGTAGVAAAARNATSALNGLSGAADQSGASATRAAKGFGIFGRALAAIQNTHIPLFATSMQYAKDADILDKGLANLGKNFITTASGFHLVAEAVIEFTAVWGPAIIGLTAFGLAAYPIARDVYAQFKNVRTEVTAAGQSFDHVNAGMNKLSVAVKPQALQLWGDWLTISSNKGSHFATVLKNIGGVLDNFAAKAVVALNSNTGGTFLNKAAGDINLLGQSFQQVGRIVNTLLKSVPGYAEILLKLGTAALTVSADVIQAAQPIIAKFLAIHGAIFYLGLAATILGTFSRAAVTAFRAVAAGEAAVATSGKISAWGAAVGSAAGALVSAGKAAVAWGADILYITKAEGVAAGATAVFRDALGAIPFGPAGLAAGVAAVAIGGVLFLAFRSSTDAAAQLNAQLEKTISASSIINVQFSVAAAMKATTAAIQGERVAITQLTRDSNRYTSAGVSHAIGQQKGQIQANTAALQQYADQSATAALRLNSLGKSYGDTASLLQLFNLAGVKQGDIATANAQAWALDQQKLLATAAAYGFIGQQAGTLGNQLDTLNISTGTTAQAVQTLTSAEQNWLGIITGGEAAFTAFIQGNQTLADTLKNGANSATNFTVKVGGLKQKYDATGAAMNGTSQAALAVRQAFTSQITAAGTLYGSLQMLAAASGNTAASQQHLNQAGRDIIATLLPFAKGSAHATTSLYGLAQVAGYRGANSFAALAKWVGNAKNATADLDKQQQALARTAAELSKAARNLGNALVQDVTQSQAQAILSSSRFNAIQNNLINTLGKTHGKLTGLATTLAGQYYQAMVSAGIGTDQAKAMTDALLQKLGVAPGALAAVNAQLDQLQQKADAAAAAIQALTAQTYTVRIQEMISIPGTVQGPIPGVSAPGLFPHHAAGAYIVRGSGPSGQDSTLRALAPGELVIPTSHAPAFKDMAKRAGVPGLQGGGSVSSLRTTGASQTLSALLAGSVFSFGANSLNPLLAPADSAVSGPQSQPVTQVQGTLLIQLLQQLVRLMQQQPHALGTVINGSLASGTRHAFFATGG
jgi:hypothetical protein